MDAQSGPMWRSMEFSVSLKFIETKDCMIDHMEAGCQSMSSVSVVAVSLPVVVHGPHVVERLPGHLQQSGSSRLPPPRGHGGQHGQ